MPRPVPILVASALLLASPSPAEAETVNVAVAANFTAAAKEIAAAFAEETGHEARLSFGSTGTLYAQITQGAPFEVFLAADDERPQMAVDEGYAVPGSLFTYALGRIVLYSRDGDLVAGAETLQDGGFDRIAIANPVTAPYGAAAVEAMKALGVHDALRAKIVRGNSIAQTYQFIATGNAPLGFVALSQVANEDGGSRWIVPADLHEPIRQDAVLLKSGEDNEAAKAFLDFLQGPDALEIIEKYGYGTDGS